MSLVRTIRVCWPDIHPKAKTNVLAFGDRLDLARHFPCAWGAFSIDILTDRAGITLGPSGLHVLSNDWKRVPFLRAIRGRWKCVTLHAGFIGLVSWRFCREFRARAVAALEAARVPNNQASDAKRSD